MPELKDKNRFVFFKYAPSKGYAVEEKKTYPIISEDKTEPEEVVETEPDSSADVLPEVEESGTGVTAAVNEEESVSETEPVETDAECHEPEENPCVEEPQPDMEVGEPCEDDQMKVHIIRPGDTFWKLAKEYDTTVEAIVSANPQADPLNLQVGSVLFIPGE